MSTIETQTTLNMTEAEAAVREQLAAQGFGILSEIDVAGAIAAKLGVQRPALKLLGACNPQFANAALDLDPAVSMHLPCTVVLSDTGSGTKIMTLDPREIMSEPSFAHLAGDVSDRLAAAIAAVPKS